MLMKTAYADMTTNQVWAERRRLAALRDPAMMGRYLSPKHYNARAHTKLIASKLTQLGPGGVDRLMVFTPPQVGKSVLVSELMPFWWLCKHPRDRVIIGSYATSLAKKKSKAVRDKVEEHGAAFGLHLDPRDRAVTDWSLTTGGGIKVAGVNSALTGFPANIAAVDDPHKNRKEAESKAMRDNVWSWWSSTVLTRLSPGAPVMLVQTRWHEDDLAGRLLRKEGRVEDGGRWVVVNLPAVASHMDDPLGREPGDPLTHPLIEDDDTAALAAHWQDKRSSVDARDWGALYQGEPKPREGALLKQDQVERQRHFGIEVGRVRRAVSVDPSGGGKDTAGIVAGFLGDDQRVYITHDWTRVMPSTEWARQVCLLAYETEAQVIYVEKSYGGDLSIIPVSGAWDQLQREGRIPAGAMKPWIEPKTARSGKYLRAEPIAQAWLEDRVRTYAYMPELEDEWETWVPGPSDSPGRIDASVYLVFGLLQLPGSEQHIGSAAGVSISQASGAPASGGLGSISLGRGR
ncbi:terminase large subunit domain-containing protein [Streptomyces albidoflavus]